MSEEKLRVLDMLKEGKITTDEALSLLNQLDGINGNGQRQYGNFEGSDFGWISSAIKDSVQEALKSVQSSLSTITPFGPYGYENSRHLTFSGVSEKIQQRIESLVLTGKNSKIEVFGYDGDNIQIEARYKTRGSSDPCVEFQEKDGHYRLVYDEEAVQSMGMEVKVPYVQIAELFLETTNAGISLEKAKFDKSRIITKNSSIQLHDIAGKELSAETRNASIKLNDVFVSDIDIRTTNAKIMVEKINADKAKLQTSNASVQTIDSDIRKLTVKTSNAGIHFGNIEKILSTQYSEYTIDGYTTNGSISIDTPRDADIPCKIKASTTRGSVNAELNRIFYKELVKQPGHSHIDAQTESYNDSNKKITITLQTTNANINIRNC